MRIDAREVVWDFADYVHLAQDGDQWGVLMNTVMKLQVP
jgi:hypothetical protein